MIEVNNLTFAYPGKRENTLVDISFRIDKGEIFGFLGPSGAGKSTTQKLLIKLLKGYVGEVKVMNKDLSLWKENYYNHIGVGFELPNHYLKLSALENLEFFASFYDKTTLDPMSLLERVGLAADANQKVEKFSKGMKMRLNFVRALLHDPDVLFFDEPTSGLDPVNAKLMKDIIIDLRDKGKVIFLTTHNMHDADELCNEVAFIVNGTIKLIDSPRQLKIKDGKRKIIVEYMMDKPVSSEFGLDDLGNNDEFLKLIKKYRINSIHSEEASLNEVFIKATGQSLV